MIETILQTRSIQNKDWATLLFVFTFVLIAMARTAFETRFNDFLKILVSDKYIKVYKDSSHLMSGFTILLFLVQLLSVSFFIQFLLHYFGYFVKTDWIIFLRIFTFFSVFVLSKFLIEKIISVIFNLDEFTEQFNLQKVSYRTFIGIVLLPINIYLFYNDNPSKTIVYGIIIAILTINMLTYIVSLKIYQNLLIGKLFYFILYLCALEIAPYYFMYYWFTKGVA